MNDFNYVVDPGMQYADIIVPTLDTVRASYMIELLLTNDKQVRYNYIHVYILYYMVEVGILISIINLPKLIN